jgi:hypothetical protein
MSPSVYDDLDIEVQREESSRFAMRQAEAGDTNCLVLLLNESGPVPEALKVWLAKLFDPRSDLEFADLPLNFHPAAIRASAGFTPWGADGATCDRLSWSGLRSRSDVAERLAA